MTDVLIPDAAILAGRSHWRYRGQQRPDFAEPTAPGEESVWDFPRPPRLESVDALVEVRNGGQLIAQTQGAVRVLETAGAPTYYVPPEDVHLERLHREGEASVCEWKGVATTFRVDALRAAAWCYERTFPEFSQIRSWLAFYPTQLNCFVDGEPVKPQPGGYYGGWVLANLRGPIKGEPGSGGW